MTNMIANLDFIKERNISAVYKSIVTSGGISRIQIARQCNLAAGSVTRITKHLLSEGLIHEVERQESERGRKATSLSPKPGVIQILAARAGRSHLHIGLCDLSGELLAKSSTPISPVSQYEFREQIIRALEDFRHNHADKINIIAGVGITVPGLVNSAEGIIKFMPHLEVQELHLAEQVSKALKLPCYLGNSISSMALAEHRFGSAQGYDNNLLVRVHNGVGLGMILDGQLYEGNGLAVGEIGHVQINPVGKRCYCGNFGCLETEVSNSAIEQSCSEKLASGMPSVLGSNPNILQICQAAQENDALSRSLIEQAAKRLGQVISFSVNLLRPECIVLSGQLFGASDIIIPVIQHCIDTQTVSVGGSKPVRLAAASLDGNQWLGGFSLVRRALLEQGLLLKVIDAAS